MQMIASELSYDLYGLYESSWSRISKSSGSVLPGQTVIQSAFDSMCGLLVEASAQCAGASRQADKT